ncbi:KPN_02809 family neutral zinc metallopeptidase [Janibacter massiliensis]|uniref:KPN_02809 family neutral zinc metallopeptidase n=1 Tax=Janibacter massiliensis TaxID=2058291 RepID=UPI000D113A48|nr:neutral zinc metallopeptidase [Janibacter massiliensis]
MSFNENAQIDTSNVSSGGGGRGPMIAGGGGILGLIIAIVGYLLFPNGADPTGGSAGGQSYQEAPQSWVKENCKTGKDANEDDRCLVAATAYSAETYWETAYTGQRRAFEPAQTVVYEGATQSACGTASNQVGPFYCPTDETIYVDASFFGLLERMGSSDGQLAKEYVVAHEYGHHIQHLYNLLGRAQQDARGEQSGAVRVELMADCLAGMWAQHASSTDSGNGTPFLKGVTEQDVQDALSAAKAVGDDTIQETQVGRVNRESWTHGSAQARQKWLMRGMNAQSINECDTFAVRDVENP